MFEILCQGGCNDLSPVISLIINIIKLMRILVPAIFIAMSLFNYILPLIDKKKKSKERTKSAIKDLIVGMVVLIVLSVGLIIFEKVTQNTWDNKAQCWCGR
jgi:amino acid permease